MRIDFSPRNRLRFFTIILLSLLLVTACQSAGPADPGAVQKPTSTFEPDAAATDIQSLPDTPVVPGTNTEPPAALLQISEEDQTSGVGSYCWTEPDAEMALCVDKVGIPTAPDPLQITSPFVAEFILPLPDQPDILPLSAIPVSPDDQMPTDIDGMRWWPPLPGDQFDLPLEAPRELELSLAPGLHVLSVFAQWQDIGDVSYGFLVEVLPSQDTDTSGGENGVSAVVILADAGLNLRTGPDSAAEVIGILPQNELVEVSGASPDGGWWQVACPDAADRDCWISADPRWSKPANPVEYSLAGLIYSQLDQQSERPLWLIEADGTPTLFLESSQGLGALSPDGVQGINCCLPRGETNLYLTDLATGDSLQLTNTPERLNFNPQWWEGNPDTIVFVSRVVDSSDQPRPGPGNLAVVKTDGTGFEVLDEEHVTHSFLPALAPDGQTIAYNHGSETAYEDGILTPWLYHLEDGPSPFKYEDYGLSDLPGLSFGSAAWSPDGKYLAWVVGGDLAGDGEWKTGIAMFDLEEQSVEILAPHIPASCLYAWCPEAPQWSPDGEWLTWYVSPAGGLPSFWIMQPNGKERRLIDHAAAPIWSPDIDLLVYTRLSDGSVMVMETATWQPQRTGLPGQIATFEWISLIE